MYRVRTVSTGVAGAPWYTNVYFREGEGRTANEAATAMRAFWESVSGIIASSITMQVQPDVAIVNELTGEITGYDSTVQTAVLGQSSSPIGATVLQGLISLRTGGVRKSRKVQGRIFVPGIVGGNTDAAGTPSSTMVAALQTAANGLIDDLPNVQPVVWCRPFELLELPFPGAQFDVTAIAARDFWAVLRSRRD